MLFLHSVSKYITFSLFLTTTLVFSVFAQNERTYTIPKGLDLKSYTGGTDPILLYIFLFFILFSITITIAYFIIRYLRKKKYLTRCISLGLSKQEKGLLEHFINFFQIKDPLNTIVLKNQYDHFSNRIAHHFSISNLTEEKIQEEIKIFDALRKRLKLNHSIKEKKLNSSRSLIKSIPLHISYYDSGTNNTLYYIAHIVDINDLYIGISLPPADTPISNTLFLKPYAQITVSFVRKNDAEYSFDSKLFRTIQYPETMLYISHSSNLTKGIPHKKLDIPCNIMYVTESTTHEVNSSIEFLNPQGCSLSIPKEEVLIKKGANVIINFKLEDEELSIQGIITEVKNPETTPSYELEFRSLRDALSLSLLKFTQKLKMSSEKR